MPATHIFIFIFPLSCSGYLLWCELDMYSSGSCSSGITDRTGSQSKIPNRVHHSPAFTFSSQVTHPRGQAFIHIHQTKPQRLIWAPAALQDEHRCINKTKLSLTEPLSDLDWGKSFPTTLIGSLILSIKRKACAKAEAWTRNSIG